MNWQEWIVWIIFAVAVVAVWRWVWRTFLCRSRRCEECRHGHCGIRDKAWDEAHRKLNEKESDQQR